MLNRCCREANCMAFYNSCFVNRYRPDKWEKIAGTSQKNCRFNGLQKVLAFQFLHMMESSLLGTVLFSHDIERVRLESLRNVLRDYGIGRSKSSMRQVNKRKALTENNNSNSSNTNNTNNNSELDNSNINNTTMENDDTNINLNENPTELEALPEPELQFNILTDKLGMLEGYKSRPKKKCEHCGVFFYNYTMHVRKCGPSLPSVGNPMDSEEMELVGAEGIGASDGNRTKAKSKGRVNNNKNMNHSNNNGNNNNNISINNNNNNMENNIDNNDNNNMNNNINNNNNNVYDYNNYNYGYNGGNDGDNNNGYGY
eukprot:Awhi_evm1s3103